MSGSNAVLDVAFSFEGCVALLGVGDLDDFLLVREAAKSKPPFETTVLSVLAQTRADVGEIGAAILEQQRKRQRAYARLFAEISGEVDAVAVKGLNIARSYPPWAVRQYQDLDVLVADADSAWRALELVLARHPSAEIDLAVTGPDQAGVAVAAHWEPPQPVMEARYRVEIYTDALLGFDGVSFGVAEATGGFDDDLMILLAEAYERELGPRDVLDFAALTARSVVVSPALSESIRTMGLDGAFAELSGRLSSLLGGAAQSPTAVTTRPSPRRVKMWHGYPVAAEVRPHSPRWVDLGASQAFATPFGNFLMTTARQVTEAEVRATTAALGSRADAVE